MSEIQVIKTPMPFPTIPPNFGTPVEERPWVQKNWHVILIILHVFVFVLFVVLLVTYLLCVRAPGKSLTEDYVDDDGYSRKEGASSRGSFASTAQVDESEQEEEMENLPNVNRRRGKNT